jgi:hypothetical protein
MSTLFHNSLEESDSRVTSVSANGQHFLPQDRIAFGLSYCPIPLKMLLVLAGSRYVIIPDKQSLKLMTPHSRVWTIYSIHSMKRMRPDKWNPYEREMSMESYKSLQMSILQFQISLLVRHSEGRSRD